MNKLGGSFNSYLHAVNNPANGIDYAASFIHETGHFKRREEAEAVSLDKLTNLRVSW